MDINQETSDKKLLLDKIIKLIPKNEINDIMKKFRNELTQNISKDISNNPSNELEEEKNHSEEAAKILTSVTENPLFESDIQENDIKEEIIEKKNDINNIQSEDQKEKVDSVEIIELLEKEKQKLDKGRNQNLNLNQNSNMNTNINKTNVQKLIEDITLANQGKQNQSQKKEKEEEDEDYWIQNLSNSYPNQTKNNSNNNIISTSNQNTTINSSNQNVPQNKYLTKKRRAEIQEEQNALNKDIIPETGRRITNRRISNINYNQNPASNYNNYNQPEIEQKIDTNQTSKEKNILNKLVQNKGFLFMFNLLTKPNLSRNDPLEKYIDDLIGSIGLLKVSLFLFQIYFESERAKSVNKRDDHSDILIDIDNENDFLEQNNTLPNNNYSINMNNMNMNMNVPNYQNNYSSNINQIPYNPNYSNNNNNNYNSIRSNINNNMMEQNIFPNNVYQPQGDANEKNVSKYFNNNFSYDQQKSEAKRKDNRVSFSLKSTGLSLHFHKDEIGNVYKYSKHHFFGKDICVFYCCDKECRATANYYMNTLRFVLVNKHNKDYSEHIYIKKPDRDRKVMDDMRKRPEHEGQMFKRADGSKIVKWYDMLKI